MTKQKEQTSNRRWMAGKFRCKKEYEKQLTDFNKEQTAEEYPSWENTEDKAILFLRGKGFFTSVWRDDVLKALSLKEQEVKADERKRQYKGLCTNCGKPDKFSKSTLCSDCISKWKVKLREQAKSQAIKDEIEFLKEFLIAITYSFCPEHSIVKAAEYIEERLKHLQEKK